MSGNTPPGTTRRLLEVYPHPALLSLLRRDRRVPYNVGKSQKYWPRLGLAERVVALLDEFAAIHAALTVAVGALGFELPPARDVVSLAHLKRYEDALDAVICAWVGTEYLAGRAAPLGDDTAAIWCPGDVIHRRGGPSG